MRPEAEVGAATGVVQLVRPAVGFRSPVMYRVQVREPGSYQ